MDKTDLIKRNLNGLPSNLALSYLATGSHTGNGKMGEWLIHFARLHELTDIEIDILSKTVSPMEIQAQHITKPLGKLKDMIKANLKKNGLAPSFIKKAVLRFEIPKLDEQFNGTFFCFPSLEDENGVVYKGKKKVIGKSDLLFNPNKKIDLTETEEKQA